MTFSPSTTTKYERKLYINIIPLKTRRYVFNKKDTEVVFESKTVTVCCLLLLDIVDHVKGADMIFSGLL